MAHSLFSSNTDVKHTEFSSFLTPFSPHTVKRARSSPLHAIVPVSLSEAGPKSWTEAHRRAAARVSGLPPLGDAWSGCGTNRHAPAYTLQNKPTHTYAQFVLFRLWRGVMCQHQDQLSGSRTRGQRGTTGGRERRPTRWEVLLQRDGGHVTHQRCVVLDFSRQETFLPPLTI